MKARDDTLPRPKVNRELLPTFDELRDAVFSLQLVRELLPKTEEDAQYWKWVIVALHSALQGFMVLALRGPNSLPIMLEGATEKTFICPHCKKQTTRKNKLAYSTQKEWIDYCQDPAGTPPSKAPRLIPFLELYKLIQSPDFMERLYGSRVFEPTPSQSKSVKILNNPFRNEFIHFFPKTSTTSVKPFLPVVKDAIDIIELLAFESDNILWYAEELKPKTRVMIAEIRKQVDVIETAFESQFGRFMSNESDGTEGMENKDRQER